MGFMRLHEKYEEDRSTTGRMNLKNIKPFCSND